MPKILKKLIWCAMLTTVGCTGNCPIGSGPGGGGARASALTIYNCTVTNGPGAPVSGRAFRIVARISVDGPPGGWTTFGDVNAFLTPPSGPCEDTAQNLTLDLKSQPGQWEIHAMKIPRADELPPCTLIDPLAPDACLSVTYFYIGDSAAAAAKVDLTSANQ